jgi:diguanylate cyclase (GGDEF)-like protein
VDETGLSGIDSSDYRVMEDDDDFDETSRGLRESILTVKSPIGRWGGEEFMVLLRETPIEKALDFAEKVRKAFNEMEFEKAGHRSVSVGVVKIQEGESADSAYVRVDQALYKAKENGRNQVFQA